MKKKIYYILLICFIFIPFIKTKAVSSSEVDFNITHYYVQSDIDIAGSLNVKEMFVLDGTFNGFERAVIWKQEGLDKFSGKDSDFEMSDIYNSSKWTNVKVGIIDVGNSIEFKDLLNTPKYFTEKENATIGESGVYLLNEAENDAQVRIYNETISGQTAFYLEYTVPNVAVKHNDIAEFYYPFLREDMRSEIEEVEIRVFLPEADETYRIWAHGPLNGSISKTTDNTGAVLRCSNLSSKTPIDIRMTYDKELFPVAINSSKISNMDALDKILKVEEKRADDANAQRKKAKKIMAAVNVIDILLIIGGIFVFVIIYLKVDKEYKSSFNGKYYREINEDYPVETISYIMNKKIDNNSMLASFMNLIYKKNISVKPGEKKKEYIFTLENENNITDSEKKLIELFFNYVGDGKTFSSIDMKDKAKKNTSTSNQFYDMYTLWKDTVIEIAETKEFYANSTKYKVLSVGYGIFGLIICFLQMYNNLSTSLIFFIFIICVLLILYSILAKKRSVYGNEEYHKWKAFKNFLKDFGRFNEKELPEVKLWEKLLVYAAVFGLADKVSDAMKLKFESMHPNYDYNSNTLFYPYYMGYSGFVNDFDRSLSRSISAAQTANSQLSSGSGSGGGFSGGSSFGGGGSFGGSGGF